MSPFPCLFAVALIFTFRTTEGGQLCGICSQIIDPRDCDTISECGNHEECFVRKYVNRVGHVLYDVGCYSSFDCPVVGKRYSDSRGPSSSERAAEVQTCSSCCNDTELCNVIGGHCNIPALDLTGMVLCYNCDYMHSPDQCDRIRACSIHEQCYIGERESGLSGALLWTSRCGHGSADCRATGIPINGVVGRRRSFVTCTTCCSSNLCNNNCSLAIETTTTTSTKTTAATTINSSATTKLPVSKPVITYITRSHEATLGSQVHLTCRSTGNPTPGIVWTFFASADSRPKNVMLENRGADLYITGLTPENYGHYSCNVTNTAGTDIRYVDILEPGSGKSNTSSTSTLYI